MKRLIHNLKKVAVVTTGILLASPLYSCNVINIEETTIAVDSNFNPIIKEHTFNLPLVTSPLLNSKEITLKLTSEKTGLIHLLNDKYMCQGNKVNAQLQIDDAVQGYQQFSFNLECTYSANKETKTITLYNVKVFYIVDEPVVPKDRVFLKSKTDKQINNHIFTFRMNFVQIPQSEFINVKLLGDSTHKIHTRFNTYKIIDVGTEIYADIIIDLDLDVNFTRSYGFDLQVDFINSLGNEQSELFTGCVALYQRQFTEVVPLDYLDLTSNGNGELLCGFKPQVSKEDLNQYTILEIPEGVKRIKDNAFNNDLFANIEKIVFNGEENYIGDKAFYGASTIYELDMSKYELGIIPEWLVEDQISNFKTIFNKENIKLNVGYIWLPSLSNYIFSQQITNLMRNIGLRDEWEAFNIDLVTNDDDFVIDGTKLISFSDSGIDRLSKIKIIRIPNNIESIEDNLAKPLSKTPYENTEVNGINVQYETRRLIIGRHLLEIPNDAFKCAGISGPLLFLSTLMSSIGKNAFYRANIFGWPPLGYDIKEELIELYYFDNPMLQQICSYAFAFFPLHRSEFQINLYTEKIDEFAFYGSQFNKIVFSQGLDNIGNSAFSNSGIYPSERTINCIDASCYREDKYKDKDNDPSCIPPWIFSTGAIFENSCAAEGGTIYLSTEIRSKLWDLEEDLTTFRRDFFARMGIPGNWNLEYI